MNVTSAKRGLTSAGKRGATGADDLEDEPQKKPKRRKAHVEVRPFLIQPCFRIEILQSSLQSARSSEEKEARKPKRAKAL